MFITYLIGYILCIAISWAWLEWTEEKDRDDMLAVCLILALFWPVVLPIGALLLSISWAVKRIKQLEKEDD